MAPATPIRRAFIVTPGPSLRVRLEEEHRERQGAFTRHQALQARMDGYRAKILTPSGRDFDSLPIVSLSEMRKDLCHNAQTVAGSLVRPQSTI
eukprot:6343752-Prymnesium_polylepis.1